LGATYHVATLPITAPATEAASHDTKRPRRFGCGGGVGSNVIMSIALLLLDDESSSITKH
jgi:hypothetical protein